MSFPLELQTAMIEGSRMAAKPEKIFYDTEFLDDGRMIHLISLAMVPDDGAELYLINRDSPLKLISAHKWLCENVVPSLPLKWTPAKGDYRLEWDEDHPDYPRVVPRVDMANTVRRYVLHRARPQLWAWFNAHDHVALTQLFGPMSNLPSGFPQRTNDIAQIVEQLDAWGRYPEQSAGKHNALDDARWNKELHEWLHTQTW